jgi:type VI secretion system protein ImpC
LRLPYGADTDPLEHFDFEEMTHDQKHKDYLWGNPCFAGACLLGQAFSAYGWDMRPGAVQDVSGLPLHVYQETGETRIKPCAEVVLTERAAEIILDKGFMLLLSFRDQDMIRLIRFQSLALPPMLLAGRWKE